jgi:hypothetical protein
VYIFSYIVYCYIRSLWDYCLILRKRGKCAHFLFYCVQTFSSSLGDDCLILKKRGRCVHFLLYCVLLHTFSRGLLFDSQEKGEVCPFSLILCTHVL